MIIDRWRGAMMLALWVFLGGGTGAVSRFGIYQLFPESEWPWATLTVNVVGSCLIGFIFMLAISGYVPNALRVALVTGFLGGFTTFSAFSLESVMLLNEHPILAVLFIIGKVVVCILAAAIGMMLAKLL